MRLNPWIERVKVAWFQPRGWIERWLVTISNFPITELLTFVIIAGLYFYNAVRFPMPLGYAGFFALMTEQLAQHGLVLPAQIPFYGPGGVPFAYPPLGLYIAAIVTGILRVPIFTYLRWTPPLFSMLAFCVAYLLFREILSNRKKALLGTLLTAMVGIIYTSHATAAGMVRALALLLSLAGLLMSFRVFRGLSSSKFIIVSAILFGMTFLTHLSYGIFTLLSLLAFLLTSGRERILRNSIYLALIAMGGLAVAAPWYLTVFNRYGAQVFLYAGASHGSFGILHRASSNLLLIPVLLTKWFYNFGSTWKPFFLGGVGILGFCYAVLRRRWLLPIWLISIVMFLGEAARFEAMLASMLAAELIFDIASMEELSDKPQLISRPILSATFTTLILVAFLAQGLKDIRSKNPALSQQALEVSTWIQENTNNDAHYLLLSESHDLSEWFPYLTRRTPTIAYWGSEWTGRYLLEQSYFQNLRGCVEQESASCVYHLIDIADIEPNLFVLYDSPQWNHEVLAPQNKWMLVYDRDSFMVYSKNPE